MSASEEHKFQWKRIITDIIVYFPSMFLIHCVTTFVDIRRSPSLLGLGARGELVKEATVLYRIAFLAINKVRI